MISKKSEYVFLSSFCLFIVFVFVFAKTTLYSLESENTIEQEIAHVTFYNLYDEEIVFECEIADTFDERSQGLIYREEIDDDKGMLFVYNTSDMRCFWMKNCLIPLDIIFIDEDNRIINIEHGQVQYDIDDSELNRYCSQRPAKYVVEINQGICEDYNIISGGTVKFEQS